MRSLELGPTYRSLDEARADSEDCRRCPLWRLGTQTVFGEGRQAAHILIVGEQPGDQEDRAGRPFVGPAGAVLDKALAAAGIVRGDVYVTNAVKHFKWEPRGKRRIHKKPNAGEIDACRWWLDAERRLIAPLVTVALGATAARGVLGRTASIMRERGRAIPLDDGTQAVLTLHPSYILRLRDEASKDEALQMLVADLRLAAKAARSAPQRKVASSRR
jgi:uracil-DNA glycosylase